jgi:hypothetical protein
VGGAVLLVQVEQCSHGPVLVVVAVSSGQVAVQVGGQDTGVVGLAEARECEAVALAGIDEFACQQQVTEGLTEMGSLVEADEPGCGEPGAPFEFQEAAEVGVTDLASVFGQGCGECVMLWFVFPQGLVPMRSM